MSPIGSPPRGRPNGPLIERAGAAEADAVSEAIGGVETARNVRVKLEESGRAGTWWDYCGDALIPCSGRNGCMDCQGTA